MQITYQITEAGAKVLDLPLGTTIQTTSTHAREWAWRRIEGPRTPGVDSGTA